MKKLLLLAVVLTVLGPAIPAAAQPKDIVETAAATVIKADAPASNGIIHIIGAVLIPK